MWLLFTLLSLGVFASAQILRSPARSGAVGLVTLVPRAPFRAEQTEKRIVHLKDGTQVNETVESTVYRDSKGRLRIDSTSVDGRGRPSSMRILLDPTAGSAITIPIPGRLAIRMMAPKSGSLALPGFGEALSAEEWTTQQRDLGSKTIEGIECNGVRVTRTSIGQPEEISVLEYWQSSIFGVTLLAETSGPNGGSLAKLRNVRPGEPDPELFVMPSGYEIREIGLPEGH
jgi:hypothetical protein